jgi:hypothetical protein
MALYLWPPGVLSGTPHWRCIQTATSAPWQAASNPGPNPPQRLTQVTTASQELLLRIHVTAIRFTEAGQRSKTHNGGMPNRRAAASFLRLDPKRPRLDHYHFVQVFSVGPLPIEICRDAGTTRIDRLN